MLQFLTGRAGAGKSEYLRRMVVEKSGSPVLRPVMIVPEQYSFETEKKIFSLAGPVKANRIDVVSFTRLANLVFRREGGIAGKVLSDGGRRMMMRMAIASCKDHLEVYGKAAESERITDAMLTAISEFKLCGITAEQLRSASAGKDSVLQKKLLEIALVYSAYDAMLEGTYLDSRDDLTRLEQRLQTSDFFAGRFVAVDSFEGFTPQERKILACIMRRAEHIVIALCTDNEPEQGTGLFSLVNRTKRQLKHAARMQAIPVGHEIHLEKPLRYRNKALMHLEQNLFRAGQAYSAESQAVRIITAQSVFEEAEWVAAAVRNLVMDEGYAYRDFTIVCRSPERYYDCVGNEMQKRDIPCFLSVPERVDAEPVMRFVLNAFEVVCRGFAQQQLFAFLKTGITGFTAGEISDLENYAFTWKLTKEEWLHGFTKHPEGFGKETTDETAAVLRRLNDIRSRAIVPLRQFQKRILEASGREISEAVYALMIAFELEIHFPAYCERLRDTGEIAAADKQMRVWELMMEILEQMAAVLGEAVIDADRYASLLKDVIRSEDISEIPNVLDEVVFGKPEQVRQSSPKVVFILGAAQGEFPLLPQNAGLFSDAERRVLIQSDLPLGDPLEQKTIEERYLAYSVCCLPSEKLYVSYPASIDGEEKAPSEIVNAVAELFPSDCFLDEPELAFLANSKAAAFTKAAAAFSQNTPAAAALLSISREMPEYKGRMEALARAASKAPVKISEKAAEGFFGDALSLSASRIESFFRCPFQYFCRYGLKARERMPAEINAMQYGTIMHDIFEKVFSRDLEEVKNWTETELLRRIELYIAAYAEERLGGMDGLDGRERYRLRRLAMSAVILVRHVCEELAQSKFQPAALEMNIGTEIAPLKIRSAEGHMVSVSGIIDRVDVLPDAHEGYARVVDYKTGQKDFHLADVVYGLNMQMLVYLAALVSSGRYRPAGILYTPLAAVSVTVDPSAESDEIKKEQDKSLRMNGMVLSDPEIIRAMEDAAKGKFIPASIGAKGDVRGSAVNAQDMDMLLQYCQRLIATMADRLCRGEIGAAPMTKRGSPCAYCAYAYVCGQAQEDEKPEAMDDETALQIIREELKLHEP